MKMMTLNRPSKIEPGFPTLAVTNMTESEHFLKMTKQEHDDAIASIKHRKGITHAVELIDGTTMVYRNLNGTKKPNAQTLKFAEHINKQVAKKHATMSRLKAKFDFNQSQQKTDSP
jgi:hypothetical protein